MRRLSLSTKLFAAALPLILAVGGLLALTVRSDFNDIARAESGADLGAVWDPLITALGAVETEAGTLTAPDTAPGSADAIDPATRRATDQAVNDLRTSIEQLDAFEAASVHVTAARSSLSAARRNVDMASIAPEMAGDIEPAEAYAIAGRELVAVGQLLPSEAGEVELGRELLAVVKLAEARLLANEVIAGASAWADDSSDRTPLAQARAAFAAMITTIGEFEAIAPEDWAADFRQSGLTTALSGFSADLTEVARSADSGGTDAFDVAAFSALVDRGVDFQREISTSIVDRANAQAADARSATLFRSGIILAIVVVAALVAWFITRSVTRRVKAVADSANQVAEEQLPALVEALRDPRGKAVLPDIAPVDARGHDDLADLARAFNSMQETLIDVAHEQVEVLRRGVSDIFITMARRNRSLIDRQLSMLDEFEAGVDDPDILSNYYQLDHLATRMRRNSESLLVLANAEPKRRRVKATEIDDVVRASIGEVEDYRRIEIQHLESLQVRGTVVADISHLMAELLDNATSFSPPGSTVRVGGRRAGDSYMLRIVDDGVGVSPDRLDELNELLREPPIVGLSVESTLGISVVSLLANKHGIAVTLSAGSPGLTVDIVLPSALFGPMDAPTDAPTATPVVAEVAPEHAEQAEQAEQIVAWNELATDADQGAHASAQVTAAVEPEPTTFADTPEPEPTSGLTETPSFATPEPTSADPTETPSFATPEPTSGLTETPSFATPEPTTDDPTETPSFATPEPTTFAEPLGADDSAGADRAEPAAGAAPPAPAGDWTTMSLDVSTTTPSSDPAPSHEAPTFASPTPDVPTVAAPESEVASATADSLAAPTETPDLPPPPPARPTAEFDVPPAPPVGTSGLSHRPVAPAGARPAMITAPPSHDAPALPTRTQRGTGPDGPDRLADPALTPGGGSGSVASSEPGALQAALAAFDSGRAAVHAEPAGSLPTRDRVGDATSALEDAQSATQSRVDPSALRDRLRAFQSEFSSAHGGDAGSTDRSDSGGDPR